MTEVWLSVGKKHCEICKCWVYNNKICWDRHQQGGRHKSNVAKKLRELGQKRRETSIADRERQSFLMQMETGGLASYKADQRSNSAASPAVSIPVAHGQSSSRSYAAPACRQDDTGFAVWFEAITDSGRPYYWNCVSGKSQWKPPKDGYVTVQAQLEQTRCRSQYGQKTTQRAPPPPVGEAQQPQIVQPPAELSVANNPPLPVVSQTPPLEVVTEVAVSRRPAAPLPIGHPYGQWQPVIRKEESVAKPVATALPAVTSQPSASWDGDDEDLKFPEKTLKPNAKATGINVAFKKRKSASTARLTRPPE